MKPSARRQPMIQTHRIQMLAVLGGIALAVASAHAGIIYIDAVSNAPGDPGGVVNTVLDGAGSWGPNTTGTAATDGMWSFRTRSTVNGDGILVAAGDENATPNLRTTITLPSAGVYNIYGYFWINNSGVPAGASGGNWDIAFQLGAGTMTTYRAEEATNLSGTSGHFTDPGVKVQDGTIHLFEASLGTWDTSVSGLNVTFYINDPETGRSDDRTWYDGVGYEFVIPEPATFGLIGAAAVAMLLRRRFRRG